ncbi:uncharacterized protein LOC135102204 isoform X2 [Scylla paramamosain]
MDEVFGNSSSDTVMEAELSQVLETIRHDIASLHHHQPQSSASNTTVAHAVSHTQATMLPSHFRADPLTCSEQQAVIPRSCKGAYLPGASGVRPVPYPRVISVATPSLRHTQSAVESRVPPPLSSSRPRAFSTSASPQSHSYVNIQACRPASTYDNVQEPTVPVTKPATPFLTLHTSSVPKYMNVPLSPHPHSSSAPTTPQRGNSKQLLHHSYIELWSGIQEERDSLSDSECEELKRSLQDSQTSSNCPSPGYVQMTSPFIKSPQVTSPFNGSVLANFATKLASYAGQQPRNIFCPFCPRYFGYEKSLSSHIHKSHRVELNSMVENMCNDLVLQFCPICQAQFYNSSVLPKHLTDFHRASVIEVLEKHACITSDTMGIHCPFCTKMVPHGKTGEQVLLYHMQQLHMSDYNAMIGKKFKPYTAASLESLKSLSSGEMVDTENFQPGVTSTPGLSNRLGTMALAVQALNLDTTWSSHTGILRSPVPPPPKPAVTEEAPKSQTKHNQDKGQQLASSTSKGILRHQNALGRKPSVKRELRFSVPPVTSEEVFVPESPDPPATESSASGSKHQQHQICDDNSNRVIPIRVDSLSAADFVDLTTKNGAQRKRRRLGLGLRSRKAFKKKDKENVGERELNSLASEASKLASCGKKQNNTVTSTVRTQGTRTFRRPKPVAVPRVPELPPANKRVDSVALESTSKANKKEETDSPFINLKLYSPLRMFRCNGCHVKFCDNESLSGHIGMRHKGLLHLLRPQYGCGVCSAKFFENKYLVKHCLQHHTSLLEIRSPCKHKVSIYRFTQD